MFLINRAPIFPAAKWLMDVLLILFAAWCLKATFRDPKFILFLSIFGVLCQLVVFTLFKMYQSWRSLSIARQIINLFWAWLVTLVLFNVVTFVLVYNVPGAKFWPLGLFKVSEFSRWAVVSFCFLALFRIGLNLFLRMLRKRRRNLKHAVVVGAGDLGKNLVNHLTANSWMGIKVRGFFDDRLDVGDRVTHTGDFSLPVLGLVEDCPAHCLDHDVDMVFIALPMRAQKKIQQMISTLGIRGVQVLMVPDLFAFGLQKASMLQMGDLHLMAFNLFPAWKRVFDVCFSLLALMVTSPVWAITIFCIKLEDRGPIFFSHPRITESGKKFGCLKFRTMHVNADKMLQKILGEDPEAKKEWEKTYKLKNDPRITKVGRFLRKTSLDELPQFLNVLQGHMSVVGARPIVANELTQYYKSTALTYCAMKPGITGPWQVGKRSNTEDYEERVALDRWYVINRTIWIDLSIIFKTLWVMISRKGAY